MKRIISAQAFLAAASLAVSPAAWSLGLGSATVESYLDQPLKAKIELVTRDSDDLASVTARLGSAEDYELIGASLADVPVPVRFTIEDIDGDAYLLASSNLPISNPVVRLIVEVNWSSGRMLREYTLFLDPPAIADQAPPAPRIDRRAEAPQPAPAADTAPPPVAETAPPPAPEPRAAEPASPAPSAGEYGPVASGETLWGIARDWSQGTDLSINKVMIAIQRENPDAFMDNNINLLKRGAILRMPAVSEVERISAASAYQEVAAQEAEIAARGGSNQAASTSMPLLSDASPAPPTDTGPAAEPAPESDVEAEVETAATDPDPAAEDSADTMAADPAVSEAEAEVALTEAEVEAPEAGPSLELIPPSEASELDSTYGFEETEEGGDASLAAQALRENLARAEEDLITQQQQNQYLEERIRELEAQLEENEEATVADSDLANMEQRLREARQAAAAAQQPDPWYVRYGGWLVALLVAVIALFGWRAGRRGSDEAFEEAEAEETIQEIADEAEELLRVLEDAPEEVDEESESGAEAAPDDSGEEEAVEEKKSKRAFGGTEETAEILDEESSDPEIQLDLARAYISMGDKEAARAILEEVVNNGSEEQQTEARKMLDLM